MKSNFPVIELAKELIRCPSVTPQDASCQQIISNRLSKLGFHCETMRFGNVDNLWARLGNSGPLFVFAGHTDVVPPGPLDDWLSPPFKPEIRNEYLYGRGISDMKGALAAMIVAVEQFLAQFSTFPFSLAFLITSDEEGPAVDGTKKVIEELIRRGEKIDYCIIGEPSSEKTVGDQIRIGRRGSLHGKMHVHGKQGHVAHAHLAKNPIHLATLALHELAQTIWDEGNEYYPPTTFQITNIHSGTGAANVIPGHLEVLFNFRFCTASTVSQLKKATEVLLSKHALHYDIEWHTGAEPFLSPQGKLIPITQEAIKYITQLEVKLSTGGGTSDGRFIAETGAEVVELGLTHTTAHQVNECVKVEDLSTLVAIYERMLMTLCHCRIS